MEWCWHSVSEGTSKSARDFEGHCQHRCLLLLPSTIMVNRTCPSRRTSERTKKCLTGHKWVQHWFPVFRDSSLSQSGVIVEAKVSDRQRRCCRNIIGCKSSFTCHVLLGFCLLSYWVQFKVRSLSFWKWFGAIWHLQPGTALSLRLRFFFSPKQVFGFTQALRTFSAEPNTMLWSKRHCLGILQSVDLLNMMQLMHILSRFKLTTYAVSRSLAAGNCFQKPRHPAVRNFDQFSRNSSIN